MRTKLGIGADVDFVSPEDLRSAVLPIRQAVLSLRKAPTVVHYSFPVATDGASNLGGGALGDGIVIYQTPTGTRADIQRILLDSPSYTPSAPLATGWIRAARNSAKGGAEVFWPATGTTVLPSLVTDGDPAIRLNDGDRLVLVGAGLAVNIEIVVNLQVRLWDDYPGQRGEQIP